MRLFVPSVVRFYLGAFRQLGSIRQFFLEIFAGSFFRARPDFVCSLIFLLLSRRRACHCHLLALHPQYRVSYTMHQAFRAFGIAGPLNLVPRLRVWVSPRMYTVGLVVDLPSVSGIRSDCFTSRSGYNVSSTPRIVKPRMLVCVPPPTYPAMIALTAFSVLVVILSIFLGTRCLPPPFLLYVLSTYLLHERHKKGGALDRNSWVTHPSVRNFFL